MPSPLCKSLLQSHLPGNQIQPRPFWIPGQANNGSEGCGSILHFGICLRQLSPWYLVKQGCPLHHEVKLFTEELLGTHGLNLDTCDHDLGNRPTPPLMFIKIEGSLHLLGEPFLPFFLTLEKLTSPYRHYLGKNQLTLRDHHEIGQVRIDIYHSHRPVLALRRGSLRSEERRVGK